MKKRVLSFGAHPDDIEIGCGGTELKLIQEGYEIFHAYLTSGEAGSASISKEELAQTRETEARNAARELGAQDVFFFRFPDGLTGFDREMKIQVINLLREIAPQRVFVHARQDQFPDHRICHDLVMSAITGAAGPWYQEASGKPHRVEEVLGYEVWNPLNQFQVSVDITKYIEQKTRTLQLYPSQMGEVPYHDAFQGLARYRGAMSFSGKYAEVFEALSLRLS